MPRSRYTRHVNKCKHAGHFRDQALYELITKIKSDTGTSMTPVIDEVKERHRWRREQTRRHKLTRHAPSDDES